MKTLRELSGQLKRRNATIVSVSLICLIRSTSSEALFPILSKEKNSLGMSFLYTP